MPHAVDPKPLGLPRTPLCPGRLFVFLRKPLCLLTVCFFRSDPTLPAIFIAETSRPIVRCRIFSGASHLITKLITSSAIQGFPWRLGLSESSRIKPFLDLAGHRRRKQGFNSPRLQVLCNQVLTYMMQTKGNNISIIVRQYPLEFTEICLHFPGFTCKKRATRKKSENRRGPGRSPLSFENKRFNWGQYLLTGGSQPLS